jgi:hypothetical protein
MLKPPSTDGGFLLSDPLALRADALSVQGVYRSPVGFSESSKAHVCRLRVEVVPLLWLESCCQVLRTLLRSFSDRSKKDAQDA